MSVVSVHHVKQWLKHSQNPLAKRLFQFCLWLRRLEVPAPRLLSLPLYHGWKVALTSVQTLVRICWWTPLFKGRLTACGRGLNLYGGLPFISGPLKITVGHRCRISGHTTFSGRAHGTCQPELQVGDNVGIGWQTTIAVGTQVILGNNVRIAGRSFLCGYPGHPVDPVARAAGQPDADSQTGDIILEDDVWLGTGVYIMPGVHIGQGTIVAAGSIVTKSLPPGVLAAGNPAKVLRTLIHPNPLTRPDEEKTDAA